METVELEDPRRHEILYFPDGNVVICSAGAGSNRVLFRVHKSLLSAHSTVFKDMFALPTLPGVDETYDGVPVVVTADEAKGWEDLLGLLYHMTCAKVNSNIRDELLTMTLGL